MPSAMKRLHDAAHRGNTARVKTLLDQGGDVNASNKDGLTAVHIAAARGRARVLTVLLAHGADANAKAHNGQTAASIASQRNRAAVMKLLLSHGAAANGTDCEGLSLAYVASQNGSSDVLKVLLAHGADISAKSKDGRTAAYIASRRNRAEVMKVLLGHGAKVNEKDSGGYSLAYVAAQHGHEKVLKALLAHGADANDTDGEGLSLAYVASQNGSSDVLKVLLAHGADISAKNKDGRTAAYIASRRNRAEVMKVLLGHGAKVNEKDSGGYSLAYVAAQHGHEEVLKALLAHGADANDTDGRGFSLLYVAAQNGYSDVLKVLLAHGADISAKSKEGRTAAYIASRRNRAEVMKVLLGHGAKVNEKDSGGYSLAYVAAQHGHEKVLKALLAHGADANDTDGEGLSLAYVASQNGSSDVLKVLLAHGADISAKNKDRRTAAYIASRRNRAEVMKVLLGHGTKVNEKDSGGYSLAYVAAQHGHEEVLKALLAHGADANDTDGRGFSLLYVAAQNGYSGVLKILLAHGVDVNGKCENGGWRALHAAAWKGHVDVLKVLVAADGAEVDAKTLHGKTAAQLASKEGNIEALKVLVAHGADLNVTNSSGKSVADVAAGDCVAYLAELGKQTLPELRKQLHAVRSDLDETQSQLNDSQRRADRVTQQLSGATEASLLALLGEVSAVMDGPDGWASPQRADPAGAAQRAIAAFGSAREALSTALAAPATTADPFSIARHRADCCAAALSVLEHFPSSTVENGVLGVPPRPPPTLIRELQKIVSAARRARRAAITSVKRAVSTECSTIAEIIRAAVLSDTTCAAHVDAVRTKLGEARAAATPTAFVTAEECQRQRALAEAMLEAEQPWAGDAGIECREAALVGGRKLVARRAAAQRAFDRKEKLLAVAKAALAVFSDDDDDGSVDTARAALEKAEADRDAALPALLAATAVEYPAGLVESPAAFVFYAERVTEDRTVPVVLRRLRLSSPELVQEAQRQVRDAGRIAVGLPSCHDAAAGCPPMAKATRWFLAAGPGGGTADAWLEFPRAEFGSLAEALVHQRTFNAAAAASLCMRLTRAVAQMHAAGIRHGDLNPSNVVLWDDPASDVVRPGIIDLLDTAVVGTTRTLRGATLEWLPPEATGTKAYGTRELDCWQLGRVCEAVLNASSARPDQLLPLREAAAALCVADPAARSTAATALLAMDATLGALAAASVASPVWALPPATWLCERGEAPGVAFVALDVKTDPAAAALVACAASVGRRVRSVHRLENLRLWHVYAAERARVAEEAQGAVWPERLVSEAAGTFPSGREALVQEPVHAPGEALLLHGSPAQSHRLIAEGGLDPSFSGDRSGASFGTATCLTPSWQKAANEYARGAGAGVFVTRAAVGRVADCLATSRHETRQYRRPPDGHHSVVGDNKHPGAVVAVYRSSRMYPEYLVVFDD